MEQKIFVSLFSPRHFSSSSGKYINVSFGHCVANQTGKWSISYQDAVNFKSGELITLAGQVSFAFYTRSFPLCILLARSLARSLARVCSFAQVGERENGGELFASARKLPPEGARPLPFCSA